MKSTELLAPAKDKETAFSAINCGADAVYLGAFAFGARRNAPNTLEDIEMVVNYAHKFWVKVYVTVNTILTDEELSDAVELVKNLDKIGVDAVIVQDMGLVEALMKEAIDIPLHISTQCNNRDIEKIKFFDSLGFSRVVLARELSLKQIAQIHKEVPNIELETFAHGALCVSYSGQCYLSHYIGGRSANRGECAQPCRKKYTIETVDGKVIKENVHALCLRDFNTSGYIKELIDSGVYSFKIEGRLKEQNYVKNITAFYRQELDKYSTKISSGRSFFQFVPNPSKSFNRGFTDYFLHERTDCFNFISPKSLGEYLGTVVNIKNGAVKVKTDKIINSQDGITNGIDGVLVNKFENGYIYPNRKVNFNIGDKIYRNVDIEFEKQLTLPVKRQISLNVNVDKESIVTLIDEDGIQIQHKLDFTEKSNNPEKMKENFIKQFLKTGESDFYIENIQISSEIPFMPISKINELRRFLFSKLMEKRLEQYKRNKQKCIHYVQYYKKELDYRENVYNICSKEFYEKCGADVNEMALEKEFPKHQVELMRTKHCIKFALKMCKSSDQLVLRDEFGTRYPLKFDCTKCEMCVLSPQ